MPILGAENFEKLYAPFTGKAVCFVPLDGNVGDHLNHQATCQFFDRFGIDYQVVAPGYVSADSMVEKYDEAIISGGGNMGGAFYQGPYETRRAVIKSGLPITVFPQSFVQNEEDLTPYKKVYVRERGSLRLNPAAELAPDLALGFSGPPACPEAAAPIGVFLRQDAEQKFADAPRSLGDPAQLSSTVPEYFDLAARFEHIVTDRLHFAIAALLLQRKVTLLPNSYFKNRSFYKTWLADLCAWRDDLSEFAFDPQSVGPGLFRRLAGPPGRISAWAGKPVRREVFFLEKGNRGFRLAHATGSQYIRCNETGAMVWQLSDGERTVEDIVYLLTDAYPEKKLQIARDVQRCLRRFVTQGAMVVDNPATGLEGELEVGAVDGSRAALEGPGVLIPSPVVKLEVREPRLDRNKIRYSALLGRRELWFAVNRGLRDALTSNADPFVLAILMQVMHLGVPLRVVGAPVSSGLLPNLEEFQRAWCCWRSRLEVVDIEAEQEARGAENASTLACFSGGVDSCYTMYRRVVKPDRRWRQRLDAALLIRGFDFHHDDRTKFELCYRNASALLADLPVELLSVQTNLKQYTHNWLDTHGLLLAACLTLFGGRFGAGAIGATLPYAVMQPHGSNPTTDWMMGSDDFTIIHDGAEAPRLEKVRTIADWPVIHDHLRVCWSSRAGGCLNCGGCLSCVLTSILFQCVGVQPACLPGNITPSVVLSVMEKSSLGRLEWYDMKCVLAEVERRSLRLPWVPAIEELMADTP